MKPLAHSFPSVSDAVAEQGFQALKDCRFSRMAVARQAEARLSAFTSVPHALLTGSGFGSIQVSLLTLGAKSGSKVLLPTVTCPSVFHAVCSVGLEPIVKDVSLDAPLLGEEAMGPESIVLFPQMFGLKRSLAPFAAKGMKVLEDCAQAFGPKTDPAAEISIFSFSPTKLLTVGYAGALLTRSEEKWRMAERILDVDHALPEEKIPSHEPRLRIHSSIADFQAAMLLAQLDRYDSVIHLREGLVALYDNLLGSPDRLRPEVPFRYSLLLPKGGSEKLSARLQAEGIDAKPLGSHLLHRTLGLPGKFPNAEKWRDRVLSLPLHEKVSESDIERTADLLRPLL